MSRILIVDDETTSLKHLEAILKDKYELSMARNGREAMEVVDSIIPDLIILDIQMPIMNGFETCVELRRNSKTSEVPILMITSLNRKKNEKAALELGASDFISKPFVSEMVLLRIQKTLALRRYQQRLEVLVELRTQQFLNSQEEILRRLSVAGDYRDDNTGAHLARMELYSLELLRYLDWKNEADRKSACLAIRLHDIGKIGVPDSILFKPGPLNEREWKIMRTHPLIGAEIIGDGNSRVMLMAKNIALNHHERWDGSGYPRGLKADENDLVAYVAQIADVYDALRSQRPYKKSLPHDECINCIINGMPGDNRVLPIHFHPDVLIAFHHTEKKLMQIFEKYSSKKIK